MPPFARACRGANDRRSLARHSGLDNLAVWRAQAEPSRPPTLGPGLLGSAKSEIGGNRTACGCVEKAYIAAAATRSGPTWALALPREHGISADWALCPFGLRLEPRFSRHASVIGSCLRPVQARPAFDSPGSATLGSDRDRGRVPRSPGTASPATGPPRHDRRPIEDRATARSWGIAVRRGLSPRPAVALRSCRPRMGEAHSCRSLGCGASWEESARSPRRTGARPRTRTGCHR